MSAQNLLQPQHLGPRALNVSKAEPQSSFIAVSPAARKLVRQVEFVAPRLQIATIEGEPGVGKQTVAEFVHSQSAHARSPLNRYDARAWLLAEVDPQFISGFIYLDRVDLLSAPGQALLLRVLRSLQNRPKETLALLASSEGSLREMAAEGRYLPELAFRLTAIRFVVPPLRERKEDILPLATSFLQNISQRYQIPNLRLASDAIPLLLHHDWPANARELSSVLESAILTAANGVIRAEDLPSCPLRCLRRVPLPHYPRSSTSTPSFSTTFVRFSI
jgi:two-component system response regulator AtoC